MVDPEVQAIADALRAKNLSQAELGRALGLDSSQMTRLLKGSRRLQRHEWKTAAAFLGLADPGEQATGGAIVPMPGLIPLYGWAGASSQERLTFADQCLRGYVPAHPNQAHVRAAFALEVADVSMSPRYEPGEVIYIAPNRWPTRGQDCVVVTRDGGGYLKRFVRRTETEVIVSQLNPAREIAFALDAVEAVHTVVGRS